MNCTQTLMPITITYETANGKTLEIPGSVMVPDAWMEGMPEGTITRVLVGDPRRLRGDERWHVEEPKP